MSNYTTDSIQVLSDMDHVRLRYQMYIGEPDNPRQLFSELLDNALDESESGYSDLTEVFVDTKKNSYRVRDYGRGIPIGKKSLDGKEIETLELLITKLFSGGKFDTDTYRIRNGLHGVGLGCCNALSSSFSITTYRDGKSVHIDASKGNVLNLEYNDSTEHNGCDAELIADPDIFDTIIIPIEIIIDRCKVAKAFGYNIKLYIDGSEFDLTVNSLFDLLPHEVGLNNYADFIIDHKLENGESIRVAIRYTSETNSKYFGYTNLLYNRWGGTHVRLLDRAIEDVWKNYYKESDTNLHDSDCKIGIRVICAVFISNVAFSSQTKDKLTVPNSNLKELIDGFSSEFKNQLDNDENIRKALIKRFSEYRQAQNKLTSRKEIMELVKINDRAASGTAHRISVVDGLAECTEKFVEGTEIFFVEGRSAGGTAKRARNKKLQAVLPLRGKIKNVTYMSIKDALKSEEVLKIINSVGAGVGEDADPDKCRYEKLIISADADPDGLHITALVLSVFINILPSLVKAGKVFVLEPPLFSYYDKDQRKLIFTSDFNQIPQELKDDKGFTRYKGLGEMNDEDFKESCMTPGNRNLYKVEYPTDIDSFNWIVGSSDGRHNLLETRGILRHIEE